MACHGSVTLKWVVFCVVAAYRGLAPLCLALLELRAEVDAVTQLVASTRRAAEDGWGRTALHFAAEYGHEAVISLLLREGASPSCRTTLGKTPIHFAAEYGHAAAIALILETDCSSANAIDCSGVVATAYAARGRHKQAVKALLAAAPRSREARDVYGCTPLSWALEYPLHGRDSHGMADRGSPARGRGTDARSQRGRGRSRGVRRGQAQKSNDAARSVCRALIPWSLPQPTASQASTAFTESSQSKTSMVKWTPTVWTPLLASIVANPGLSAVWSGNGNDLERLVKSAAHAEPAASTSGAESGSDGNITERDILFFGSKASQNVWSARSALDSVIQSLFRSVNVGAIFEVRK